MLDPVLLDTPDRIETARLTMRVVRAGDGPGVNAADPVARTNHGPQYG